MFRSTSGFFARSLSQYHLPQSFAAPCFRPPPRASASGTRAYRAHESMGMDMRSFDSLKLAEGFMLETGSRAIGFFSSPESLSLIHI